jgi:hypothetical protein
MSHRFRCRYSRDVYSCLEGYVIVSVSSHLTHLSLLLPLLYKCGLDVGRIRTFHKCFKNVDISSSIPSSSSIHLVHAIELCRPSYHPYRQ